MTEMKPDLLHIEVEREDEVAADRADVHVTVKGSSFVSGTVAIKRAKEVNQLVEALAGCGVSEDQVFVQSVRAEVQSGLLTRSSTAEYQLRLRVADLSRLPDVIELLGSRKNVALENLDWRYDGLDGVLTTWLTGLLAQANAKADLVARGLGVTILGVHHFEEQRWDPDRPPPTVHVQHSYEGAAPGALRARASGGGGALGFDVAHSKRVRLVVAVDYRVAARA